MYNMNALENEKITLSITCGCEILSCFHCLTFHCVCFYLFIKCACWSDGLSLSVFTFLQSAVAWTHPVRFVISVHPGINGYPGTWCIIKTPHNLQHFHFWHLKSFIPTIQILQLTSSPSNLTDPAHFHHPMQNWPGSRWILTTLLTCSR